MHSSDAEEQPQQRRVNRLTPTVRLSFIVPLPVFAFTSPFFEVVYQVLLFGYLIIAFEWQDLGIRVDTLCTGFKQTWYLFILSLVVTPPIVWALQATYLPAFWDYVFARIQYTDVFSYILSAVLVFPFIEETLFRGWVQEQFHTLGRNLTGVVATSAMFSVIHFSLGDSVLMVTDLLLVFMDSIWFGLIYMKSRNTILTYIAHAAGNLLFLVSAVMIMGMTV